MSTRKTSERVTTAEVAAEVVVETYSADQPEDLVVFAALYADLLRFAAVAAPRGVDPCDVVQEALAKTLSSHPGFRGIRDLRAYLFCSVVNVGRSSWRLRVGRDEPLHLVDVASDERSGRIDDDLVTLLEQLSPRQRVCIHLRFVEDRSVAEVAQLLGCREGTVKSQTAKAVRKLAARLDP